MAASARSLAWVLGAAVSATAACSVLAVVTASLLMRWLQRRADKADSAQAETGQASNARGFVVPARVYHARFLPRESAHGFRYPAFYLALELGALERKCQNKSSRRVLDSPRLLKYKDPTWKRHPWTVSSVNPPEYYRSDYSALSEAVRARVQGSIRLKTLFELRHRNLIKAGPQDVHDPSNESAWDLKEEIDQIWTITMPSLLGIQGINPLTTYFCYRPASEGKIRGELAFVLLEVHNTFTERHLYVLECGVNEDQEDTTSEKAGLRQTRRQGCDHQWTFPRTFHVSPFNDRGGFYTCSVKDLVPSHAARPELDIRVTLLIPDPEVTLAQPSADDAQADVPLVKKMVAILTSHPATTSKGALTPLRPLPLCASNFSLALLRQPLDLFLTFARIAYEAGRLHWGKNRLDVFGKPEMDDGAGLDPASAFSGVGWPPSLNPTEPNRSRRGTGGITYSRQKSGALVRSVSSASDDFGEKALKDVLRQASAAPDLIGVELDEEFAPRESGQVTLYARSAAVFSDLLLYPPWLAHVVGSRVARRWGVSDTAAYLEAFAQLSKAAAAGGASSQARPVKLSTQLCRRVRALHVRWALAVASTAPDKGDATTAQATAAIEKQFLALAAGPHPFELASASRVSSWTALAHLAGLHLVSRAEEAVFRWVGARYVRGMEPWTEVRRAVELLAREQAAAAAAAETADSRPAWFYVGSARRDVQST